MSREQGPIITYGDVFEVSSKLASKPITSQDAAIMQSAETVALDHVPIGGPASIMRSAATQNERLGAVTHDGIARDEGVTVSYSDVGGTLLVSESIGTEIIGQYIYPSEARGGGGGDAERAAGSCPTTGVQAEAGTIGEALEAAALSAGDKPVGKSDAAAIQVAEARAVGVSEAVVGGIGAEAQYAAVMNAQITREDEKTTLADILTDATGKLIDDKPVTEEDEEGVEGAEIRNKPDSAKHPGGVAASIATAATLNKF